MNRTDNIFGGLPQRSKERQAILNGVNAAVHLNNAEMNACQHKKEKKREKSFVLEIKELTKQVGHEIRRDMLAGKIDAFPVSNKRTNMTTLNAKKEHKKDFIEMDGARGKVNSQNSKGDISMNNNLRRKKSKSKGGMIGEFAGRKFDIKEITKKINKQVNKTKKSKNEGVKSFEQTIDHDKHLKL